MKTVKQHLSLFLAVIIMFGVLPLNCMAEDIPQPVLNAMDSVVKIMADQFIMVDEFGVERPEYGYVSLVSLKSGDYYCVNGPADDKKYELGYVGTGFVVENSDAPTTIVTAAHVVSNEVFERLYVYEEKGEPDGLYYYHKNVTIKPTRISCIIGDDILVQVSADDGSMLVSQDCDFAILKLERSINRTPATLNCGEHLEVGKMSYALGFPQETETYGKQSYTASDVTVTSGNISKYSRQVLVNSGKEVNCYTTTARVAGGNSGGPLVNEKGEVIGINVQGSNDNGRNEAVDISELITVLGELGIPYRKSTDQENKDTEKSSNRPRIIVIGIVALGVVIGVIVVVLLLLKNKKKQNNSVGGTYPASVNGAAGETTLLVSGGTLIRRRNGQQITIASNDFPLGRDAGANGFSITDNSRISRVHVRFFVDGTNTFLLDNNASNGTFVNGVKILPGQYILLNNGDVITIADELFDFLK